MTTNERENAQAGPVTWPEVIAHYAPLYERDPDFFEDLPHDLAASKPPDYAGAELAGFDVEVAALAVLRGPSSIARHVALVAPALPHVIAEIGDTIDADRALPAFYTLSYCNAARCAGAELPAAAVDAEEEWLPQLAERMSELTEPQRHTLALAACAAARVDLVATFAELAAGDDTFTPSRTFGFNVPEFAGYVARAIDRGASYQDVEPAWLDFVHRFPYKLDTRTLGWPALLFAARAVYATIGELPEGEVAMELHRLVAGA